MEAVQDHKVKIKELFDQLTAEIPGTTRFRAINEEGFKMAIDVMMNEAFYMGQKDAVEASRSIFSQVFSHT
jgi:hypothetical protein